jgi:hypothetical protein
VLWQAEAAVLRAHLSERLAEDPLVILLEQVDLGGLGVDDLVGQFLDSAEIERAQGGAGFAAPAGRFTPVSYAKITI